MKAKISLTGVKCSKCKCEVLSVRRHELTEVKCGCIAVISSWTCTAARAWYARSKGDA